MEGDKRLNSVQFEHVLELFPVVEAPMVFTDETHIALARTHEPLDAALVQRFLLQADEPQITEFSEFMACCQLAGTEKFHALVYWRAELQERYYTLITFSPRGVFIDKKVFAGTKFTNQELNESVGRIEEDWSIIRLEGTVLLDPDSSLPQAPHLQNQNMFQLTMEGEIISFS